MTRRRAPKARTRQLDWIPVGGRHGQVVERCFSKRRLLSKYLSMPVISPKRSHMLATVWSCSPAPPKSNVRGPDWRPLLGRFVAFVLTLPMRSRRAFAYHDTKPMGQSDRVYPGPMAWRCDAELCVAPFVPFSVLSVHYCMKNCQALLEGPPPCPLPTFSLCILPSKVSRRWPSLFQHGATHSWWQRCLP